jgi:hypothetical protein
LPHPRYDVFISYSSRDKNPADIVCAILERQGLRCWIAPRDILPGAEWGESIIQGIEGSATFVLILSSSSNKSPPVRQEAERALNQNLPIIPFRIENVAPSRSLEFFVSSHHWLDAFTPTLEQHSLRLAHAIGVLLGRAKSQVTAREQPRSMTMNAVTRPGMTEAEFSVLSDELNSLKFGKALLTVVTVCGISGLLLGGWIITHPWNDTATGGGVIVIICTVTLMTIFWLMRGRLDRKMQTLIAEKLLPDR